MDNNFKHETSLNIMEQALMKFDFHCSWNIEVAFDKQTTREATTPPGCVISAVKKDSFVNRSINV